MDVSPSPGMWITQNLVAHQGDYNIMRVHHISEKQVYFDLWFDFTQLSSSQSPKLYCRGYNWDPTGERSFAMSTYVFQKAMFQQMKRPRPEMRREMIRVIIEGKKKL